MRLSVTPAKACPVAGPASRRRIAEPSRRAGAQGPMPCGTSSLTRCVFSSAMAEGQQPAPAVHLVPLLTAHSLLFTPSVGSHPRDIIEHMYFPDAYLLPLSAGAEKVLANRARPGAPAASRGHVERISLLRLLRPCFGPASALLRLPARPPLLTAYCRRPRPAGGLPFTVHRSPFTKKIARMFHVTIPLRQSTDWPTGIRRYARCGSFAHDLRVCCRYFAGCCGCFAHHLRVGGHHGPHRAPSPHWEVS